MPLFDFQNMNSDDLITVAIISLETLFLVVVLLRAIKIYRIDSRLKVYAEPMIYIGISLIFIPLLMLMAFMNQYTSFNLVSFTFINWISYLVMGYIGLTKYIKNVFRVPQKRTINYYHFPKIFLFSAMISLINGLIRFITEMNRNLTIIISSINYVIIFFAMLYLYFLLNQELTVNISRLSKARIKLFQYIVAFQTIQFFLLVMGVLILLLVVDKGWILNIVGVIIVVPIGVLSGIFLLWSVDVPEFLRKRYNLESDRFVKFKDA